MASSLPTHSQLLRQRKGTTPGTRPRFYDKRAWHRARRRFLASHPLCSECERQGRVALATDVHHRTAIADGGGLFDEENLEGLCHSCHSKQTVATDGGFGRGKGG